jgi:hypothetical protein
MLSTWELKILHQMHDVRNFSSGPELLRSAELSEELRGFWLDVILAYQKGNYLSKTRKEMAGFILQPMIQRILITGAMYQ